MFMKRPWTFWSIFGGLRIIYGLTDFAVARDICLDRLAASRVNVCVRVSMKHVELVEILFLSLKLTVQWMYEQKYIFIMGICCEAAFDCANKISCNIMAFLNDDVGEDIVFFGV